MAFTESCTEREKESRPLNVAAAHTAHTTSGGTQDVKQESASAWVSQMYILRGVVWYQQ